MNPEARYFSGATMYERMPISAAVSNTVGVCCHASGIMSPSHPLSWFTTLSFAGSSTEYPTIPWMPGATPVVRVERAEAVVLGNPASIVVARVIREASVRACPARARSGCVPRPSTTTTTIFDDGPKPSESGCPERDARQLGITSARLKRCFAMAGNMAAIL